VQLQNQYGEQKNFEVASLLECDTDRKISS